MEKGWKQVLLTALEHQAAIAKSILDENGITSVIINHKDSVYVSIGEYAVYVEEHFETRANELLKDLKN